VEMYPPPRFDVQRLEKQIHQQGLAPADTTPEVDSLRDAATFAYGKPAPEPCGPGLSREQSLLQFIQAQNDPLLCLIPDEVPGVEHLLVSVFDRHR
jgi:hypothetical protein